MLLSNISAILASMVFCHLFQQTFTKSHHGKFDFERQCLRLRVLAPLETHCQSRKQKTENLLQKWILKNAAFKQADARTDSHYGNSRTGKTSRSLESLPPCSLKTLATVFAGLQVSLEDFCPCFILMSLSQYRTIPATVWLPAPGKPIYRLWPTLSTMGLHHLPKIPCKHQSFDWTKETQSLSTEEGLPLIVQWNLKKTLYHAFFSQRRSCARVGVISTKSS